MKKLITAALPYVNNVPHLGNLIGSVLSADVYARYCRMRGYETLYICGTDEYGTATEMKALQEHKTPQEICDYFHEVHKEIYAWFQISFDVFGRTSTVTHSEITQNIFKKVDEAGYITKKSTIQFYDETLQIFLADRYLRGQCPHCGFEEAHGDQCDKCGKLLQPEDLINPISVISKTRPIKKATEHLYLDLPKNKEELEKWIQKSALEGAWSENTRAIAFSWLRDGLKQRCITRDLTWGVKVPKAGFENKVFYVWFDAPIGYISITASARKDWEQWWKNPQNVSLYQFMGKDNVPFHAIIFPSILLSTGEDWTMVHHINSTEYLNYESGKFSKSRGVGVFGNDAMESGIPADVWRYSLLAIRPEQHDSSFLWEDFQARSNNELLANLGNLVNRVLVFIKNKMDGQTPSAFSFSDRDQVFLEESKVIIREYEHLLEQVKLREGLFKLMYYAKQANKYLQDTQPWKQIKTDPKGMNTVLSILLSTLRNLAILIEPYLPQTAERIFQQLNLPPGKWQHLHEMIPVGHLIGDPAPLFSPLDEEMVAKFKEKHAGHSSAS